MIQLNYKHALIFLFCLVAVAGAVRFTIKDTSVQKEEAKPITEKDEKYPEVSVKTIRNEGYFAKYPFFDIPKIDETVSTYLKKRISTYQKELNSLSKTDDSELKITYEITHLSEQTVTVVFNEDERIVGKNELRNNQVFTFDIPLQTQIFVEDVFEGSSDYLTQLSDLIYTNIKENMGDSISENELRKITDPKQKNFEQFAVLEDTLFFYMQPTTEPKEHPEIIAIKKSLFDDSLVDTYKNRTANKDKLKEQLPKDIITTLPVNLDHIDPLSKVIALTFDDGPSTESTNLILDVLQKYDAHATFFVLGSRVESHPEMIQKMVTLGNEVGNHSWDHPQLNKLNSEQVKIQVENTQAIIKKVSNYVPVLLRPPYGAIDEKTLTQIDGMDIALWDIDPEDWKIRNKKKIIQKVMSKAEDGKVILMHDIYQTSAEAAEEIIQSLSKQGYQLVTVSQMKEIQRKRRNAKTKV